jgi:gliding motility-associated-like protein
MNKSILLFSLLLSLIPFSASAQNYLMDGSPITDCGGFFLDSGGGNGNYGANESFVTTICSDGTSGTHIKLTFSGVDLDPADNLCFFDGPDVMAPLLACADDFAAGAAFIIQATAANPGGCITVSFDSDGGTEGQGWSAAIDCVPACQTIISNISSSTPAVMPADTGWIDICPGDRIFLNGEGSYPQNGIVYNHSDFTSDFEWDFGDGNFGVGPNVSHVYNQPGGYVVQLTITDQFGCINTNLISQRIRVAPPAQYLISDDWANTICVGDSLGINSLVNIDTSSNVVTVAPPDTASFQTAGIRSDSLPLPDGTGASYETSIQFSDFSPGQILTNINDLLGICVNMEHSYLRDLEIILTCPDGTSVILHDHPAPVGGEVFLGEPFEADEGMDPPTPGVGYDYCWTPDATAGTWIEYSNANNPGTLPPGDYNSFDPLTNLLGCPLNGEWTISVQDLWGIDNGFIFSWGIEFDPDLYPNVETFTVPYIDWGWTNNPTITYLSQDSIHVSPENAGVGSYQFTLEDDFGCLWDTTVNVNILPETHPDCYNCQDNIGPFPDTTVCIGDQITVDVGANVASPPVTFETYEGYAFGNGNHPPTNPLNSTININSINPIAITDPVNDIVSICIDLETNFLSDIEVYLEAPDGTIFELTTNNGLTSDFYTQTCFTPTAVTPIQGGSSPFTGDFQPEGDWNDLVGSPINGPWTLLVSDDSGPNSLGTFNWWSITFNTENDVTYTWTQGTGLDCTVCPDPTVTPVGPDILVVESLDSYNCSYQDSIIIDVAPPLAAPSISCNNSIAGEITFSWNQVGTFTDYEVNVNNGGWETANGGLSHLVSGLANGTIVTIEVRVVNDGSFCAADIGTLTCDACTVSLSIDAVNPTQCSDSCDGTLELSAFGGITPYTYTVDNDAGLYTLNQVDDGLFNGLCAGAHTLIVTDAGGCMDTLSIDIGAPPAIQLTVEETQSVSCFGENDGIASAIPSGGAGNFTYLWGDPLAQILPNATLLSAGPVTVTVTDQNGCTATGSTIITQPAPLQLTTSGTDVLCFQGNSGTGQVEVMGGTFPYDFIWNDAGATTDSLVNGLTAGTFEVVVTDANGCDATATLDITEPATAVTAMATQIQIGCFGENNSIAEVTPMGGTGPNYTFNWNNGQQTAQASDLPPGNYLVTVTDENGCEATASVQVDEYEEMEVSLIFTPVTCAGGNNGAVAVTNVTGGTGSGTLVYSWDADPMATGDFINGLAGDATYSVTVTDDAGCQATNSIYVPEPDALVVSTQVTAPSCFGLTDGSATVTNVANATGMVTYAWGANAGNQVSQTASDLGAGDYTVIVTDDLGCTASAQVNLTEPDPITLDFATTGNECFGDTDGSIVAIVGGGAGGFQYDWSEPGLSGNNLDGLPSGWYYLTITDANGCERIDSTEVGQPAPINPVILADDVDCFGDRNGSITVEPQGGTPPFQYSVDDDFYTGSNMLIGLEAGTYPVYIIDANGCTWIEQAIINEPPPMELVIPQAPQVSINLGEIITVTSFPVNNQGPTTITWIPPYEGTLSCTECYNPEVNTQNTLTYLVYAIDSLGCEAENQLTVRVQKERVVEVPTGFSPNGDGQNDLLLVHGKSGTRVTLFQVFDRWGELVYQAGDFPINDPNTGWDGNFRGKAMNSGVFLWNLEVEYIDGVTESFKGSTTLVR